MHAQSLHTRSPHTAIYNNLLTQQHSSMSELYKGSIWDPVVMPKAPCISTKLTIKPLSLHEIEAWDNSAISDIDHSLHSLVNLSNSMKLLESPKSHKNKQKGFMSTKPNQSHYCPTNHSGREWTPCWIVHANAKKTKGETKKEVKHTKQFPTVIVGGMIVEYGVSSPGSSSLISSQGYGTGSLCRKCIHTIMHAIIPVACEHVTAVLMSQNLVASKGQAEYLLGHDSFLSIFTWVCAIQF